MALIEIHDDCTTAADVLARIRRVRAKRVASMRRPKPVEPSPAPPSVPPTSAKPPAGKRVIAQEKAVEQPLHGFPRTAAHIISLAAKYFNLRREDILSIRRDARVLIPRHVAMYVAYNALTHSLPQTGRLFRRDHTTILFGVRKIKALLESGDRAVTDAVNAITEEVNTYNSSLPLCPLPRYAAPDPQPSKRHSFRYTPEEDAYLREMYLVRKRTAAEVGKLMGRSICSIEHRVKLLGFGRRENAQP